MSNSTTAVSHPIPGTTFCVPFDVPDYFFAFWLPIIGFESLLCGLALFRGFQTFKASGSVFQSGRHLVAMLIRDSVLYFLVCVLAFIALNLPLNRRCSMFATYFTNLLVWVAAPVRVAQTFIIFALTGIALDQSARNTDRILGRAIVLPRQSHDPQCARGQPRYFAD
jgi:hypothetical protein